MSEIRIDKYISQACNVSRQEAKALIRSGQISFQDGQKLTNANDKVDPKKTPIYKNGMIITYDEYVYYMLHKPQGVVSATIDRDYKTVLSLIDDPIHKDLFPVGRLDIDTEGLLLITNDGLLGHRLTSPNHHIDKTYYVEVTGRLTSDCIGLFHAGIDIGEKKQTRPATLEILSSTDEGSCANITISEGKYHQIKRMFHAVGHEVVYLKRIQMGSLILDPNLPLGAYRPLTTEELEQLKK